MTSTLKRAIALKDSRYELCPFRADGICWGVQFPGLRPSLTNLCPSGKGVRLFF